MASRLCRKIRMCQRVAGRIGFLLAVHAILAVEDGSLLDSSNHLRASSLASDSLVSIDSGAT